MLLLSATTTMQRLLTSETRDTRLQLWLRSLMDRFVRLPSDQIEGAIVDGLREIVEFLEVDRSTLFTFDAAGRTLTATHSWAREGLQLFPVNQIGSELPWYQERLASGERLVMSHLPGDLPEEAVAERKYCLETGLLSNLTLPIRVGDTPTCALAVGSFRHTVDWAETTIEQLQLAGEILAAGLFRLKQEREINHLRKVLEEEKLYLQEEIKVEHDFENIVGRSSELKATLSRIERVAPTSATVLLLGETGTGKELFAHAIHERSARSGRALIKVNCAALPPSLVESELFGHVKGAFTGAVAAKKGRFELADGATLFLDEIGDLDLELQAKLLRVLQSGEFEPVGSTSTLRVDVRLIAATHRNLESMVQRGEFREDLFHRLHTVPIEVPPLRRRRDDIPLLTWHFLERCEHEWGQRIHRVPTGVMSALQEYSWPGNVRELKNVIERAVILSPGDELQLDPGSLGPILSAPEGDTDSRLDTVQREHITRVLESCDWRINGAGNAAERLGIHPNTLRHRLKKLGIERP